MNDLILSHHNEQKMIARNAIADLAPLWNILDIKDLRGTTADWLRAVRPVIERGYLTSQYVAAQFVKNYRTTVFPYATPMNISNIPNPYGIFGNQPIPDRNTQLRIMASMKVTGPVYVENLMPADETEAMAKGFSKSSGAATRLILNGGRGMVRLLADADPLALGVAGVADENACVSCKFLTNPIMKTDGAKKMNAVAVGHDFCKCSARLVYPTG